ncbi:MULTISPECIES: cellobiose-binding transcriptional regulator TxtR [Streptomyces]|uniref:cellobiose-binding transcriptional regulator TxtR n=1 Tax=Streptomyces TaxID=1883 RepID=UPI001F094FF9|nr:MULTISPECIES: helix-turn-helix domain-containing protein [Streptomyces]MDX2549401.1 helix-turn-helix domain-containing protein [Streptomyces stelliscabiei]MDX2611423.1 helix-turn-helix domain-containing protein [Streptomyces stelliscabiei]MDX2634481.1 helix-turn-helix domain-containing protein [Streptomyces stelliscabiei]MDX2659427.1 helix-turn-helix domain-containing protein [Streptomyces stelliscabiei]MDX2711073.1 helix-turn-helix domain-containing protein [Streptomyces stelliscabiei]
MACSELFVALGAEKGEASCFTRFPADAPSARYCLLSSSGMQIKSFKAGGVKATIIDSGPAVIEFEAINSEAALTPQRTVICVLSGMAFIAGTGNGTEIDAGTLVMTDGDVPFSMNVPVASRLLVLRFADEAKDGLPVSPRGTFIVTDAAKGPGSGFLFSFLNTLAVEMMKTDGILSSYMEEVVRILAISATRIAYAELGKHYSGGCDPLLIAVQESIDRQLADPEISPATLAAEHNISVRQLHRVFGPIGESVMSYVKRRRLERFACDLRDPSLGHRKINELAADWGMLDAAMLSRHFRCAYGMSPRDYRKQHCFT